MLLSPTEPPVLLRVYLIKPSKYDDRGRVLTYWRGILPSNTLTVLNALVLAWNQHRPPDLSTRTETVLWDELVQGPAGPGLLTRLRRETATPGVEAAVFVCGAQTNQYFRARDIAGHEHHAFGELRHRHRQLSKERRPVELRHLEITDDDVIEARCDQAQRLLAIRGAIENGVASGGFWNL